MDYLPLGLKLADKHCLLLGGGELALRKARLLAKTRVRLTIVAAEASSELQLLARERDYVLQKREFVPADLDGIALLVIADPSLDAAKLSALAAQRSILTNVVDRPELCSVVFPSIVDRAPLAVAIHSGGKAPILTRQLREKIEALVPKNYGAFADWIARQRAAIAQHIPDADARRHFLERLVTGAIGSAVLAGNSSKAEQLLQQSLASGKYAQSVGEVYLVGAGPGDPELLTLRALRLMQQADIVLYDRLVSAEILELVRRDAERVYVGKRRADHTATQEEINDLLLRYALDGKHVLRLKGGDPFIFGRGGEEIERLSGHGVSFQVVPGVTAASGCATYAGIPLTHRDYAQSVRFLTGHSKQSRLQLNWHEMLDEQQTLVFYMGLMSLKDICAGLIAAGRAPATPAALIQQGTLSSQHVIVGTIETLAQQVAAEEISAPTLTIIGNVVRLRSKLSWFQGLA